jgi:ABC-type multidrug transport system ATPase subunit
MAGEVWRHHNAKIAYLDQHEADQLQRMSCSSLQYMQECFPLKKDLELRSLLGSFGVKGSLVHQSLSTLSGGQRVRVVFAKICEAKPHLLILDEPTNHLDIYSIDALMEGLQNFKGAVVLVTHNCSMLNSCANELYVVEKKVCHAASCPVGMKLGDWMMQCHSNSDDKHVIPNATKSSALHSAGSILKTIKDSHKQPTNATCREESVARPVLAQISNVPTATRDVSLLRATEKEFLKCSKRVRDILKLEALLEAGQKLDKARAKKLEKKEEAVQELVSSAKYLPGDSDMLEKNSDIKELLESQH